MSVSQSTSAPFWWDEAPRIELHPVPLPKKVDVVVVGSGYAGLSAALTLAEAGREVLVLERARAGEGASSRNGGICSGNLKCSFSKMIHRFGLERAIAVYKEGIAARTFLQDLIKAKAIACHYQPVGRFSGAVLSKHYESQAQEAELMQKHLAMDVHMVPRAEQHTEIGSDLYHGGQVRPDIAGFHPGLFHLGLLSAAQAAGATVMDRIEVQGLAREGHSFGVSTTKGRIQANQVVVATNGYTTRGLGWLSARVVPVPSQIIATAPISNNLMAKLMPKQRMLGETRRVFHYYRPSPDGKRVLFGGRGALTETEAPRDAEELHADLVEIFPELGSVEVTHAWRGFTGFTRDLFPHLHVADGVYYPTGFCGSGTVWATWLGCKAAQKILKHPDGHSVFEGNNFPRLPNVLGKAWYLRPAIAVHKYADRLRL